jgi:hypothetical protein
MTMDKNLKPLSIPVQVGKAVDVVHNSRVILFLHHLILVHQALARHPIFQAIKGKGLVVLF